MAANGSGADGDAPTIWTDGVGCAWTVTWPDGAVSLYDGEREVVVRQDDWPRDVDITPHGTGYIVRFATRDREIGFILTSAQAAPLFDEVERSAAATSAVDVVEEASASDRPLMWPKVSPLAIWALFCSAMVFLPVFGILPACVTVVLLILHRKRVNVSRAWRHSRVLCRVAVALLVFGAMVHGLAIAGCVQNRSSDLRDGGVLNGDPAPAFRAPSESRASLVGDSALLAEGGFWARDINWGLLFASLVVVIVSLSVHEAAHAITAWWLGDDLARQLGRVTLNPIQHIDPFGTILLPLILFFANFGVFGWARPVPVRVENLDNPRRAHILISLAGPGSNVLLALLSYALLLGIGCAVSLLFPTGDIDGYASFDFGAAVTASGFPLAFVVGPLCTVLKLSFLINTLLACFNMIPIPPLDGSWVLQNLFPFSVGRFYETIRPYGLILFVVLIYSGVLQYLLMPVMFIVAPGFILLSSATPY